MKALSTTKALFISILCGFAWSQPTPSRLAFGQIVQTDSGTVEFTSRVPLHTFTGTSDELVGRIDFAAQTVDFYVDLSTLKTGIGKRDKDMRSTLDVGTFPFAEFFGSLENTVDQKTSAVQAVRVVGKFDIHGKSQPLAVRGKLQKEQESWKLEATWTLKLTDFDIQPPRLLIMKVDNEQEIRISAVLKPLTQ